ncbi:MAG: CoA transferase [Actinomycetota bacterium]
MSAIVTATGRPYRFAGHRFGHVLDLLRGLRVIDLTTIILGPYGTQILGDLGADVIKVETPSGDLFRAPRPGRSDDLGAGFMAYNRNKRSVVIDLKSGEGVVAFDRLLADADALVHNMRPAAADRLGLGLDAVRERHPHLVYVRAPGYDQDGPAADRPAYDDVIQAASGLAAMIADGTDGPPRYVPSVVCDKVGGLHVTIAVLAGLVARERTGQGRRLEAPMFESIVSFLLSEHLAGHSFEPPEGPFGYERARSPHRRPFETADGWIGVLPYDGGHWARVLAEIGRHDLADSDWVQDPIARSRRISELYGVLADAMPLRTTAAWTEVFDRLDVPSSPVLQPEELLDHAQLTAIDMFPLVQHPTDGTIRMIRSPFRARDPDAVGAPDRPAPHLGEHTDEVLGGG